MSWKPVPENNSQDSSKSAGTSSGESLNGGTKIVYFDPTTGMTFNVNTSIQSIGGKIFRVGCLVGHLSLQKSSDLTDLDYCRQIILRSI